MVRLLLDEPAAVSRPAMAVVVSKLELHMNPESRSPSGRAVVVRYRILHRSSRIDVIRTERLNNLISGVTNRRGFYVGTAVGVSTTSHEGDRNLVGN